MAYTNSHARIDSYGFMWVCVCVCVHLYHKIAVVCCCVAISWARFICFSCFKGYRQAPDCMLLLLLLLLLSYSLIVLSCTHVRKQKKNRYIIYLYLPEFMIFSNLVKSNYKSYNIISIGYYSWVSQCIGVSFVCMCVGLCIQCAMHREVF